MSKLIFTQKAWEEYLFWQEQDRKILTKINKLLEDIKRNPFTGIGKPEPLKNNLKGYWSRRIDSKNRIVYKFENGIIEIYCCKKHYY